MAKKPESKPEPTLSNLPMPQTDTPLVIDLPDGQKLVVGKLEAGSVIEVATWRGTGRPDSRTNRLMLGMSTSQNGSAAQPGTISSQAPNSAPGANDLESNSKTFKAFKINIPALGSYSLKMPKISFGKLKVINIKTFTDNFTKTRDKLLSKSRELTPVESVAELDIDQWLANIKRDAEAKVTRKLAKEKSSKASLSAKKPGTAKNVRKKGRR